MNTIEITLLFGAIACAIGVAGFFGGRLSAAKNDGERWGELKATLKHMQDNLSDIKDTITKNDVDAKESIRRVYDRIDEKFSEHLRNEHGK